MTKKEFQRHFDAVRCSDAFCQKMEILLSDESVPAAFADTADGVIQINRRNTKAIAAIAACLLLVIGGGAGFALFGRMQQQPVQPLPQETTDTQETTAESTETTESYFYPILTETIQVNTTNAEAEQTAIVTKPSAESISTQNTNMTEAQTDSQTETHTRLTTTMSETTTVSGTEATTTTTGIGTTVSMTTASPVTTTTTSSTSGTTTSYEWGWWYSTTYSETTTTMYHDWAVILDYDRSPMTVGEKRAVEYYHPWYRGEPLEITIVSCTNNVIYEVDSANNMIYVTALAAGNASICVRGRGAMFDSYVDFTIEENGESGLVITTPMVTSSTTTTTATTTTTSGTTTVWQGTTYNETTTKMTDEVGVRFDYYTADMNVGGQRWVEYYHPLYLEEPMEIVVTSCSSNISYEIDAENSRILVTALAPGYASIGVRWKHESVVEYISLTITGQPPEAYCGVELEYDDSPMQVGETRTIRVYHPDQPNGTVECIVEYTPANLFVEVEAERGLIHVTAIAAGVASFDVHSPECVYGKIVYLSVYEGDYATALEYNNSPIKVGETRAIRYYHPAYPSMSVGVWLIDEVSDNISYQIDEVQGYIFVTALTAGDVKIYIAADGCAFGSYAYLTIVE